MAQLVFGVTKLRLLCEPVVVIQVKIFDSIYVP